MNWTLLMPLALVVYLASICIYRLCISQLSRIPGPKLAAVTGWYEAYFELCHSFGGQYLFHIQELHKRYGPIVRISPWEVHIDDPEFYDKFYASREALQKPRHLRWRFFSPHALFSTSEHHLHRMRRRPQDPFFAKGRINELSPQIQALADRMCRRLEDDFSRKDKPVCLNDMFTSFVADVTTLYSFNRDFKYLEDPNFLSPFTREIRSFLDMVHPCTQFPWLARLLYILPDSLVGFLQPAAQGLQDFQEAMHAIIRQAKREVLQEKCDPNLTIIHGILSSDLPSSEKRDEVLIDQAAGLVAAGIVSTRWTLTLACYHIISDERIWTTLRTELEQANPDFNHPLALLRLEQLPYLTACVEEAIRLACGQITRSPRISHLPMAYGNYIMPPGTHISMDTWHMHHNETLYPDSYAFVPERWIGDARAPDGKPLKHYMVAFGKGSRNCLGMNLAQAAIRVALASLIKRFDFELVETSYDVDVKIVRDVVAPDTHPESLGVRVLVK